MGNWVWKQPSGKTIKVKSDYKKGTIIVYDEAGKLLLKKQNLSKKAIKMIETGFLNIIAKDNNRKIILQNNT